ncbi:MAG: hypothetical protein V4681_01895 [Patescibacteria group bacterium]
MDEKEVVAGAEGEVVETPEETEEVAAPAEEVAPAGEEEAV